MKTFTVLATFALLVSCIKGEYGAIGIENEFYNNILDIVKRFCALSIEGRRNYRFCTRENRAGQHLELARNCIQQVKFDLTFEERSKFLCHTRNEHEFQKFLKCFVPAMIAECRDDNKILPVMKNCMSEEETHGLKAGHHIYHDYLG